jgi:hypothetical protein
VVIAVGEFGLAYLHLIAFLATIVLVVEGVRSDVLFLLL